MSDDEDEVKLSPRDIEKLRAAQAAVGQASGLLNDLPEDVRDEYGALEDALRKLDEVDEHIAEVLPEVEDDPSGAGPTGEGETP